MPEGALREGVGARGDLAARFVEDDCRGGGCRSSEVTLSRSDLLESSDENADVGTVSRNRNTPTPNECPSFSLA